jgi:predicted DNA-binding transcriptional regulator AlpA
MQTTKETGYLRLSQIIGQKEVTEVEAQKNRRQAITEKKAGKKPNNRRKRSCVAIPPLIPISRSSWWHGVKTGKYPKPVKLGPRTTVWRRDNILNLIDEFNKTK